MNFYTATKYHEIIPSLFLPILKHSISSFNLIKQSHHLYPTSSQVHNIMDNFPSLVDVPQRDEKDVNRKECLFKILSKSISTMSMNVKLVIRKYSVAGPYNCPSFLWGYKRVNKNSMEGRTMGKKNYYRALLQNIF